MAANSSYFTDPVGRWPDTEETAAWDALIGQSACGNRFLKSDCLKMLQETDSYGTKFSRISLRDASGNMLAAWALPYRQHLGFRYATYFDFFYAGPVLAPEISATKDRMDLLAELARGQQAFLPVIETEAHLKFHDGRGLQYAGFTLQQLYTNLWDFSDPDAVFASMNRERRRLIRRAGERFRFAKLPRETAADLFLPLYLELIKKFNWVPMPQWQQDLRKRIDWLYATDAGFVFGAWDEADVLQAAVILLNSPEDRTTYLWRCGYRADPTGNSVIPGLYWHACQEVFQVWGGPMTANFGGSPRPSLAVFKDSLGSQVAAHLRLTYERPGLQTRAWKHLRRRKEDLRWLLSKTGALSLISNRPRKEVPPVEMEIQADA